MVFHRSLRDSKSHQVSSTLLSILVDLNAVVWMVTTCLLISKSFSPFTYSLGIVPSVPITIGVPVIFMFLIFLNFLLRSWHLTLFSFSFNFTLWSAGTTKSTIWQVLFFLLTITRYGRLAEIRWAVCISKSQRIFCVTFSRTDSGLCIYHLFVWSKLNFLHNSQWITFFAQFSLVLYFFALKKQKKAFDIK